MRRILFVDDEQRILDGLRDLLRKQRKQWEMVFALGGQQALAELEREPFDVVVSDMQMPGMNGVSLLERVKAQYPRTARIILSGHAEREVVVSALPVAHQFLSKPCDVEVLRSAVERVCALQSLLLNDVVRDVIGRVDRLPSVPRTYWELTRAIARPDVGLSELASIVEQDAAMSVKILQLVNSSYFGLSRKQASVRQAVAFLGTELLKALALSAHVFSSTLDVPVGGFSLDGLQRHSMLVARLAARLSEGNEAAAEAFTAALLHDIGKLLLAMSAPRLFERALHDGAGSSRPNHVVEKELIGATHAEVGAYLLGLWGLPLPVVEAVAYHHDPDLGPPTTTLVVVHVADALCHAPADGSPGAPVDERLNVAFVEQSGLGTRLPRWREIAREELLAASREAHA